MLGGPPKCVHLFLVSHGASNVENRWYNLRLVLYAERQIGVNVSRVTRFELRALAKKQQ